MGLSKIWYDWIAGKIDRLMAYSLFVSCGVKTAQMFPIQFICFMLHLLKDHKQWWHYIYCGITATEVITVSLLLCPHAH